MQYAESVEEDGHYTLCKSCGSFNKPPSQAPEKTAQEQDEQKREAAASSFVLRPWSLGWPKAAAVTTTTSQSTTHFNLINLNS